MTTTTFIQTDRLLLRSWQPSDHEPFIQMNQDQQVRMYFPGLLRKEESLAHAAVISDNIRKYGYGLFAAELKATGDFIGFIGFSHPNFTSPGEPKVRRPEPKIPTEEERVEAAPTKASHHQICLENGIFSPKSRFPDIPTPCIEIGWRLAARFWGQGLATEGATACLKTGFQKWDMTDIYSFTSIHNLPSEKVMIRIGMTRQGTFPHPAIPAGNWLCEHVLYKITKT